MEHKNKHYKEKDFCQQWRNLQAGSIRAALRAAWAALADSGVAPHSPNASPTINKLL